MKLNRLILGTIIGAQFASTGFTADDADITALKQQIQDLDQKVRILEREREIDQDAAATAAKSAPKITLGAKRLLFQLGGLEFCRAIHGWCSSDSRTFFNDGGIQRQRRFSVPPRAADFLRHGVP
jgi:phosphate-selective porin OprO/OprP